MRSGPPPSTPSLRGTARPRKTAGLTAACPMAAPVAGGAVQPAHPGARRRRHLVSGDHQCACHVLKQTCCRYTYIPRQTVFPSNWSTYPGLVCINTLEPNAVVVMLPRSDTSTQQQWQQQAGAQWPAAQQAQLAAVAARTVHVPGSCNPLGAWRQLAGRQQETAARGRPAPPRQRPVRQAIW